LLLNENQSNYITELFLEKFKSIEGLTAKVNEVMHHMSISPNVLGLILSGAEDFNPVIMMAVALACEKRHSEIEANLLNLTEA